MTVQMNPTTSSIPTASTSTATTAPSFAPSFHKRPMSTAETYSSQPTIPSASRTMQRPISDIVLTTGSSATTPFGSAVTNGSAIRIKKNGADIFDHWYQDLNYYEKALSMISQSNADSSFREELRAVESWFSVLSEPEKTAALYTLLQQSTHLQIRFFMNVLQQLASAAGSSSGTGSMMDNTTLGSGSTTNASPTATATASTASSRPSSANATRPSSVHINAPLTTPPGISPASSRTSSPIDQSLHSPLPSPFDADASGFNVPSSSSGSAFNASTPAQVYHHPHHNRPTHLRPTSTASLSSISSQPQAQSQTQAQRRMIDRHSAPTLDEKFAQYLHQLNIQEAVLREAYRERNERLQQQQQQQQQRSLNRYSFNEDLLRANTMEEYRRPSSSTMEEFRRPTSAAGGASMRSLRPISSGDAINAANWSFGEGMQYGSAGGMVGTTTGGMVSATGTGMSGSTTARPPRPERLTVTIPSPDSLSIRETMSAPIRSPTAESYFFGSSLSALPGSSKRSSTIDEYMSQLSLASNRPTSASATTGPDFWNSIKVGYAPPASAGAAPMSSVAEEEDYWKYTQRMTGTGMQGTVQGGMVGIPRWEHDKMHKEKGKIPEHIELDIVKDIPAFLRSLRLHKYTECFRNLDWRDMVLLTEDELEKRGVQALGARRKMSKVFELVRKECEMRGIPLGTGAAAAASGAASVRPMSDASGSSVDTTSTSSAAASGSLSGNTSSSSSPMKMEESEVTPPVPSKDDQAHSGSDYGSEVSSQGVTQTSPEQEQPTAPAEEEHGVVGSDAPVSESSNSAASSNQ